MLIIWIKLCGFI